MSGYTRRLCSNCGAGLGFSESDPCDGCQPYVDVVDGLLIPKNQAQSLSDFYREALEAPCDCGHGRDFHTFAPDGESLCDLCECSDYRRAEHDIVALQPHERVNR